MVITTTSPHFIFIDLSIVCVSKHLAIHIPFINETIRKSSPNSSLAPGMKKKRHRLYWQTFPVYLRARALNTTAQAKDEELNFFVERKKERKS